MNYLAIAVILAVSDLLVVWYYRLLRASRRRALGMRHSHPRESISQQKGLISIVVPAWNEEDVMSDCLAHIVGLDDDKWECIAVAGGSDHTFDICTSWHEKDDRISVLRQREAGKNGALNDGIARCSGDIVVLLDADCVVAQDHLTKVRELFGEGLDVILPSYIPITASGVSMVLVAEKIRSYEILGKREVFGGASIVVRSKRLREILPLPEDLEAGVDWDFGKRIAAGKWTVAYCGEIEVKTEMPSTISRYAKDQLRWKRALIKWSMREENWLGNLCKYPSSLFPYAISAFLFTSLGISVGLVLIDREYALGLVLVAIAFVWNTVRNITPVPEVVVFTGDRSWYKFIGYEAILHVVDLAVTYVSIFTYWKVSRFFKGPRSKRRDS